MALPQWIWYWLFAAFFCSEMDYLQGKMFATLSDSIQLNYTWLCDKKKTKRIFGDSDIDGISNGKNVEGGARAHTWTQWPNMGPTAIVVHSAKCALRIAVCNQMFFRLLFGFGNHYFSDQIFGWFFFAWVHWNCKLVCFIKRGNETDVWGYERTLLTTLCVYTHASSIEGAREREGERKKTELIAMFLLFILNEDI